MDKQCERKYCHEIGKRIYISRSRHGGYMTIECDEHSRETVASSWDRFRRGK